jgi:hypothetical protein
VFDLKAGKGLPRKRERRNRQGLRLFQGDGQSEINACGSVLINALVLTSLATFRVVGCAEAIPKRGSWKLGVEGHLAARVHGCPKTLPTGRPQITDSVVGEIRGCNCPQADVFGLSRSRDSSASRKNVWKKASRPQLVVRSKHIPPLRNHLRSLASFANRLVSATLWLCNTVPSAYAESSSDRGDDNATGVECGGMLAAQIRLWGTAARTLPSARGYLPL